MAQFFLWKASDVMNRFMTFAMVGFFGAVSNAFCDADLVIIESAVEPADVVDRTSSDQPDPASFNQDSIKLLEEQPDSIDIADFVQTISQRTNFIADPEEFEKANSIRGQARSVEAGRVAELILSDGLIWSITPNRLDDVARSLADGALLLQTVR